MYIHLICCRECSKDSSSFLSARNTGKAGKSRPQASASSGSLLNLDPVPPLVQPLKSGLRQPSSATGSRPVQRGHVSFQPTTSSINGDTLRATVLPPPQRSLTSPIELKLVAVQADGRSLAYHRSHSEETGLVGLYSAKNKYLL